MSSLNQAEIIGRLGRDPEGRTVNDKLVCTFSVATNDFKGNTEWHNIVVWGKQAEACKEYLKKGRQVYVSGRLQTRKYKGKDGIEKRTTEIVASNVIFLGSKNDGASEASVQSASSADVPF